MLNIIDDTSSSQVQNLSRRVAELERDRNVYSNLSKQLTYKTDEDVAFRRDLNDMLYNLDSDNMPMINKILKFQDDYATVVAEIRIEVSSQGASITNLVQFQQQVQTAGYLNSVQVEAIISASVNDQGGTINSYLKGNYYTQTEVNNQLITTGTTITNSITQSITQSGGSINSYLAGQFYTKSQVDGNIVASEVSVTNSIRQDITQSGGTINAYLMAQFADKQTVTSITQTVTQHSADIALVVQNGSIRGSMIIGAINNESYAVIYADRISLAGKNINLTSDNITISSNFFNVDRLGNLTATSGSFTGTVNANDGNILGRLYFGNNYNFYISGLSGDSYRLYMYYSSTSYTMISSNGILETRGARMYYLNASYLQIFDNDGVNVIGGIYLPSDYGSSLGVMSFNYNSLVLSSSNAIFIKCRANSFISIGAGGTGPYEITFDSQAKIYFNGATIVY